MIKKKTLNQQVYDVLKQMILDGELVPGDKINEVHISREMGVSPTPVREALRMLSTEGFVEIIPWKGTIVRELSEKEILEAYQCREVLEVLAIELAMDNMVESDYKKLNNLIKKSEKTKSVDHLVNIHTDIHNYIINKSNNNRLLTILESLNETLIQDRHISAIDEKRTKNIIEEHKSIIKAMESNKKNDAKEAMRNHIRNGSSFIKRKLSTRDVK